MISDLNPFLNHVILLNFNIHRILNKFTHDVEVMDITLSSAMTTLISASGWFLTGVVLQVVILPWSICVLALVTILYCFLLSYYRKSAIDLQRLDAVSRSPIQQCVQESYDGCSTIRAFNKLDTFETKFKETLNDNSSAMMNYLATQQWLSSRAQVLGSITTLFVGIFVVCFNSNLKLDAGLVGMLLVWSSNFTITLGFLMLGLSEAEASITSLERASEICNVPIEADSKPSKSDVLDPSWPLKGAIEFENVSMRYRPNLPLSLKKLTFSLKAGEKCGVVGRTGSGKSSLAVALFRLVELEDGKIVLDDVNLANIRLKGM